MDILHALFLRAGVKSAGMLRNPAFCRMLYDEKVAGEQERKTAYFVVE